MVPGPRLGPVNPRGVAEGAHLWTLCLRDALFAARRGVAGRGSLCAVRFQCLWLDGTPTDASDSSPLDALAGTITCQSNVTLQHYLPVCSACPAACPATARLCNSAADQNGAGNGTTYLSQAWLSCVSDEAGEDVPPFSPGACAPDLARLACERGCAPAPAAAPQCSVDGLSYASECLCSCGVGGCVPGECFKIQRR